MKYELQFTLFNNKIRKCVIEANSPEDAEYRLRGKIKIISTNKMIESSEDAVESFKNIFGME